MSQFFLAPLRLCGKLPVEEEFLQRLLYGLNRNNFPACFSQRCKRTFNFIFAGDLDSKSTWRRGDVGICEM